jgi:hypothetical protein
MKSRLYMKYDLNHKVDEFVRNYDEDVKSGPSLTDTGKFLASKELRNFIEAKAVFAEFRWPRVYSENWESMTHSNGVFEEKFSWDMFNKIKRRDFPFISEDLDLQSLYRIIERGGNKSGPRRGILFAEEMGLDVNIPVSYSIDFSDPYLYDLLEPIAHGLNMDLICPANYFSRSSDRFNGVTEVRLGDVLGDLMVSRKVNQRA